METKYRCVRVPNWSRGFTVEKIYYADENGHIFDDDGDRRLHFEIYLDHSRDGVHMEPVIDDTASDDGTVSWEVAQEWADKGYRFQYAYTGQDPLVWNERVSKQPRDFVHKYATIFRRIHDKKEPEVANNEEYKYVVDFNEKYFYYIENLVSADIKLEFSNQRHNNCWVPAATYIPKNQWRNILKNPRGHKGYPARYRLASHPNDCPPCGTEEYFDYWIKVADSGEAIQAVLWEGTKERIDSKDVKKYREFIMFELVPDKELSDDTESSYDYMDGTGIFDIKTSGNALNAGQVEALFDSVLHTQQLRNDMADALRFGTMMHEAMTAMGCTPEHGNSGKLSQEFELEKTKEANMPKSETIEITVDGVSIEVNKKAQRVKTDLENSGKFFAAVYNIDGSCHMTTHFKSEKQAKKRMQQPDMLGKTMKLYKAVSLITTNIPLAEVDLDK